MILGWVERRVTQPTFIFSFQSGRKGISMEKSSPTPFPLTP